MQLVILLEFMKCTSGVLTESKESKVMAQLNQTNQKTWHNTLKQGTTKTQSRASWSLRDSSTLAPDTKQTGTKKRTKASGTNNGRHAVSCMNAKRKPKKREAVKKEELKHKTHTWTLWHVTERKGLPIKSQKGTTKKCYEERHVIGHQIKTAEQTERQLRQKAESQRSKNNKEIMTSVNAKHNNHTTLV